MTGVRAVLDTSAVLAYVLDEEGAAAVGEAIRRGAAMSTVNVAEFCAKLNERQVSADDVGEAVDDLGVTIEAFLRVDAETSGGWRRSTRPLGLGLGDRACLALAYRLGVPALTADSVWATLNVGVTVRLIRESPGE